MFCRGSNLEIAGRAALGTVAAVCVVLLAFPCMADWERREVDPGAPADVLCADIGDADNDGDNELVTGGGGSGLRIYDGTKFNWSSEEIVSALEVISLVISDPDNDGQQEIVCGTDRNEILVYDYTGSVWVRRIVDRNAGAAVLALGCGDVDSDGANEVVAGTGGANLYAYDFYRGSWTRTVVDNDAGHRIQALTIGDVDKDGKADIVTGTWDKKVYLYRMNQGTWERSTVDGKTPLAVSCIDIGDSDGDGETEIVAGVSVRRVCQYDWTGAAWSRETIESSLGGSIKGVKVCDADADGLNELAVLVGKRGRSGNKLLLYEKGPSEWHKMEVDGSVVGEAKALAVGDVDDDGRLELVVGTSGDRNVFAYDEFIILSTARISGTEDVMISWDSNPGASYNIYYSDSPETGFRWAAMVRARSDTTEWIDNGTAILVHPKDVVARYYRIGIDGTNLLSNTVGKFTRDFQTEMHLISIPFVQYSNSIQDVMGNQLTGAPDEGLADRVWVWDRDAQIFIFAWLVDGVGPQYDGKWWISEPFGPANIALDFGGGFFVQTRHSDQKVTFVGSLPTGVIWPADVVPGMQIIGSAWPETLLLDSCDLQASGARGTPDELTADRVWQWHEQTVYYKFAWLVDGVGPEYNGKWWQSDIWAPTEIRSMPGYGYWYQARGNGFRWKYWK